MRACRAIFAPLMIAIPPATKTLRQMFRIPKDVRRELSRIPLHRIPSVTLLRVFAGGVGEESALLGCLDSCLEAQSTYHTGGLACNHHIHFHRNWRNQEQTQRSQKLPRYLQQTVKDSNML